jgi:hypothetical protein
MFRMMGTTLPGVAPERNDFEPWGQLFAVLWMFIGSFFALNLFVGVICDEFSRIKKETEGSATMTPEQKQWVDTMRMMATQAPQRGLREPDGCVQRMLQRLVLSSRFDTAISAVIMLNMLLMACDSCMAAPTPTVGLSVPPC